MEERPSSFDVQAPSDQAKQLHPLLPSRIDKLNMYAYQYISNVFSWHHGKKLVSDYHILFIDYVVNKNTLLRFPRMNETAIGSSTKA